MNNNNTISNKSLNEAEESTASVNANVIESENNALINLMIDEPEPTFSDVEKGPDVIDLEPIEAKLSEPTFSDVEKGSDVVEVEPLRYATNEKLFKVVKLIDLKYHPLNTSLYVSDGLKMMALAENISNNSLIEKIIINKDNEILSGNLRVAAMKHLGITETEAYVKEIDKAAELDFIISSNIQREKTITDMRNEIRILWNKYSPGQGSKESKGENTVALITSLTGYSAYKISSIRKVDAVDSALFLLIDKGEMTLNSAVKKCDKIAKDADKEAKKTAVESTSPVEKSGDVSATSETTPSSEVEKNEETPPSTETIQKTLPKKEEEVKEVTCPCCGQAVKKKNEEFYFVKAWAKKISEYVESLKSPNIAA